ncbi:hypothetical protein KC906_02495 [Candidatus Kaiserbacteria bacterium]|nr:hypothetical protein [Candidatus Kaiserbacteria bacterium]
MRKEDKLSIGITFVVGFFVGGYLYLTNFAGFASQIATPDIEAVSEFVIVSDVYGGCREVCPSFQVQNDGSYRYLFTPGYGEDQVLRQGVLPRELERELRAVLTPAALMRQAAPIEPLICNSYTDGIDVIYEITLDGEEYTLDSCGTDVQAESRLWLTLGKIWTHFESGGNNSQ